MCMVERLFTTKDKKDKEGWLITTFFYKNNLKIRWHAQNL